ncbi:MAG: tRNA lysidine(34) synthetase TilS [Clostridia bacterium]|nr:tRNA lysidine(34) synthetase TilS [Clostridia bacterium]
MSLLNILEKIQKNGLDFKITVAHINHMIRDEAVEDEQFVEEYCKVRNIPIYIKRAEIEKIAKDNKIGTEEAGRTVRYDFFEEVRKKVNANKIATAHNANDNAETIILNIIRGCGTDGLKGIEPKAGILIRPLINTSREEIEEYCNKNKLNPRKDKTNDELIYQRNKVRNVMIPYVKKEFNENFVGTLNRFSKIAKEEADYIENQAEEKYKTMLISEEDGKIELKLKLFNEQENVIKKRIIRYTINKTIGDLQGVGNIHVEDIIKMCEKNIGNKYLTPNKKIKISVKNKKIVFEAI